MFPRPGPHSLFSPCLPLPPPSPSLSLPLSLSPSLPSWILIGGTESCVRCLELTKDPDLSVVKHACIAGAFRDVLEELRARSLADCDPSLRAGPQILVENIARIQRDVFFVVQIPRYRNVFSLYIQCALYTARIQKDVFFVLHIPKGQHGEEEESLEQKKNI